MHFVLMIVKTPNIIVLIKQCENCLVKQKEGLTSRFLNEMI
jgi:hypothetical protein